MSLEFPKTSSLLSLLRERASMLAKVRSFFSEREVIEADAPLLNSHASLDAHIDVIEAGVSSSQKAFLHTSPEYTLKKLLAKGAPDLFYLGHVFRKNEQGEKHSPEFTMVEWYRHQLTYEQLIEETCELIQLFLGKLPIQQLTYQQAFQKYLRFDPFSTSLQQLREITRKTLGIYDFEEKDEYLHLLLSHFIEPDLGKDHLLVLLDYPTSQAALAKTYQKNGQLFAKRFEIYYRSFELANGYDELTDSKEQRSRFIQENKKRVQMGKEPYLLDENFLKSLDLLPELKGVSVGFDRLLMLKLKQSFLSKILYDPYLHF